MRVLLFQQSTAPEARPIDRAAFASTLGLTAEQLVVHDTLSAPPDVAQLDGVDAVIIGGSAWSVFEAMPNLDALVIVLREAVARRVPVLGVCFGGQLLAQTFGGSVARDVTQQEFGTSTIHLSSAGERDPLLVGLSDGFLAQSSHQDRIIALPSDANLLASSDRCPVQAFRLAGLPAWGVQFHPERNRTAAEALLAIPAYEGLRTKFAESALPLAESPDAGLLLRNFVRLAIERAG